MNPASVADFSPCGAIVGILRSCYVTDCRFFVGGPVGRIRYYFVPATNKFLLGENRFFGASQEGADWNNLTGTGEIAGAVRTWTRGHNDTPGRDGTHIDEKRSSDFPGRTPFALAHGEGTLTPESSSCDRHGLDADLGGAAGGSGFPDALLWYRPESLAGLTDGDPVDVWPDSSGHGNDALGDGVLSPVWDSTATPVGAVKWPIGTGPMPLTEPVTFNDECTVCVVSLRHFAGAQNQAVHYLRGTATLDDVPEVTRTAFRFDVPPDSALEAIGPALADLLKLYTVRVSNGLAEFFLDGAAMSAGQSFPATWQANLDEMGRVTGAGLAATFFTIGELILWPRALTDSELEQFHNYLIAKFGL